MGATRRRVAAQLLTETLVPGVLAAAVALAALGPGMGGLRALMADTALFAESIRLDGAAVGFAAVVAALLCLVSVGAAFAWLPRFLHRAAAGLQSGAAGPRRRWQGALLGGQVALTLVLLVGAGLLVTSLARLLDNLLFEIGPTDPASFGAATALLLSVALLAGFLPARRASRADPFVTLKSE